MARTLASVRLHRLQVVDEMPARWLRKRRKRSAGLLLGPGNVYLRAQGMSVRVLSRSEWLRWEQCVGRAVGREVRISPDGAALEPAALETPFLQGRSLAEILGDDLAWEDKLSALRAAAAALRRLHAESVAAANGESWRLSHGDATCHNVIVDLSTLSAEWIDFDMRHEWSSPVVERHADDLRALVFSSAACVPSLLRAAAVEQILAGYGEPQVVSQLRRSLERRRCPTVFQLAQGPLPRREYFRLCRCLQGAALAVG